MFEAVNCGHISIRRQSPSILSRSPLELFEQRFRITQSMYVFHLTKNKHKKLADEGLLHQYNIDPDFALAAQMIVALPLFQSTT